jgi:hypothetical protein
MGRLRGQPDWGASSSRDFTGIGQSDLELADRQNWVLNTVLNGELHFYDGFEARALHWGADSNNDDSLPVLQGAYANSGDQAVALAPHEEDSSYSAIFRMFVMPYDPHIGVATYLSQLDHGAAFEIEALIERGGVEYDFDMRLDTDTGEVSVYDDAGDLVSLGTVARPDFEPQYFTFVQLVVNAETGHYVRVQIGTQEFEYTGPARTVDPSGFDNVAVWLYAYGIGVNTGTVFVDDVIVTRNQQ